MKPNPALGLIFLAMVLAVPTAAQNVSAEASPPGAPPPPAKADPPPVVVVPASPPVALPETQNVVEAAPEPEPRAAPPPPVTIQPDAAYPNGFADPADPFANDIAAYDQRESGFPWGLLGLLGLFGLIPLFRGGRVRTVYVEEEPRRVVKREVIEE